MPAPAPSSHVRLSAAACLLAVGFILGWALAPRDRADSPASRSEDAAKSQPHSGGRSSAAFSATRDDQPKLSALLAQLESSHPSAALARRIIANVPPNHQPWFLGILMERWGQQDPAAALDFIKQLDSSFPASELTEAVLQQVSSSRFDETLNWLAANQPHQIERDYFVALALSGLARNSPELAIEKALALDDGSLKTRALHAVVDEWAKTNAGDVLQWIRGAPMTPILQELYAATMVRYIDQKPEDAYPLIAALSPGELRSSLSGQYARRLAQDDPAAALTWSLTLEDPDSRRQAAGVAFDAWASTDLETAFAYALEFPESDEFRDEILQQAALRLSRSDPLYAAATLAEFPESAQPQAALHVATALAEKDPEFARSWAQALPPGSTRDNAIKGALQQLQKDAPPSAFGLASAVESPNLRYELLAEAARSWYRVDPLSAESAISNSEHLSDTQKFQIFTALLERKPLEIILP